MAVQRKKQCPKIDREELRKYVRKHPEETQADIARHFGCVPNTIGDIIKEAGIEYRRKNGYNKLSPDTLREYLRQHPKASQTDIARYFRCHQSSVSARIKALGMATRSSRSREWSSAIVVAADKIERYIRDNPNATQQNIADFFNISQTAVSDAIVRHRIDYKSKRGETPRFIAKPDILKKYVQGHPAATMTEIARYFKCDYSVVQRTIKKYAIPYTSKCPRKIIPGGVTPRVSP